MPAHGTPLLGVGPGLAGSRCHLLHETIVERKIGHQALQSRMLLFQVKDVGTGFSLDDIPHAALNNPPEEPLRHVDYRSQNGMRPGGFGIMMVKQIADDLIYNEHGNEVLLIKYMDPK